MCIFLDPRWPHLEHMCLEVPDMCHRDTRMKIFFEQQTTSLQAPQSLSWSVEINLWHNYFHILSLQWTLIHIIVYVVYMCMAYFSCDMVMMLCAPCYCQISMVDQLHSNPSKMGGNIISSGGCLTMHITLFAGEFYPCLVTAFSG